MVLAMIRDLPAESRWSAWFHDPARGEEHRRRFGLDEGDESDDDEPQEVDHYRDARVWTVDRELMAAQINTLQDLLTVLPNWEKGKAPELQRVGPASWRSEEPKKKEPEDKVHAAMAMFGWTGPPLDAGKAPVEGSTKTRVEDVMSVFGFAGGGFSS